MKRISFLILLFVLVGEALASLPNDGRVAVIFDNHLVESQIMDALINAGYKVVERNQLEKIKQSQAAILALQGNAEAIMKLGSAYNIAYFVKGKAQLEEPRLNEFNLYTATASLSIQAYRTKDARFLLSQAFSAKAVGYTGEEAQRKALMDAASKAASFLIGAQHPGDFSGVARVVLRGVSDYGLVNSVYEKIRGFPGARNVKIASYSGGQAIIEFIYSGDVNSVAQSLKVAGLPIQVVSVQGSTIYVDCY